MDRFCTMALFICVAFAESVQEELDMAVKFAELPLNHTQSTTAYFHPLGYQRNREFLFSKNVKLLADMAPDLNQMSLKQSFDPDINDESDFPLLKRLPKTRCGKIHGIHGCMGSGKTEKLIQHIRQFRNAGKQNVIAAFMSCINTREDNFASRSGLTEKCETVQFLQPQMEGIILSGVNRIFIDEGQFVPDIYEFCTKLVYNFDVEIYIAYLDGTFLQNNFDTMVRLIPEFEDNEQCFAECQNCPYNAKANFTIIYDPQRLNSSKEDDLPPLSDQIPKVGDIVRETQANVSHTYMAVCRTCRKWRQPIRMDLQTLQPRIKCFH